MPDELERLRNEAHWSKLRPTLWINAALGDYEKLGSWLHAQGVTEWEDTVAAVLLCADGYKKAYELLQKGMESLSEINDKLKQRVRDLEGWFEEVRRHYEHVFPDRPWDAGPCEQRTIMLLEKLTNDNKGLREALKKAKETRPTDDSWTDREWRVFQLDLRDWEAAIDAALAAYDATEKKP